MGPNTDKEEKIGFVSFTLAPILSKINGNTDVTTSIALIPTIMLMIVPTFFPMSFLTATIINRLSNAITIAPTLGNFRDIRKNAASVTL